MKGQKLPHEKTAVMFALSQAFKDHIGSWAQTHNRSTSEVIRQAIAEYVDYDLDNEPKPTRPGRSRKYRNPEERKAAQKAREREKRALVRQLMEDHRRQDRQKQAQALQQSVDRKERQRGQPG